MAAVRDEGSSWFAAPRGAILPPLVTQETVICICGSKISLFLGVSGARPLEDEATATPTPGCLPWTSPAVVPAPAP